MPESASRPLGPIALSLSGGGYRAAAYHLGVLSLLDRAGVLDDVVGLSTVSGGTIVGCAWAVGRLEGEPFERFEARFAGWLRRTNVVEAALGALIGERPERRAAWPSLIRSAAEVYARPDLLGDRSFHAFLDAVEEGRGLQETIFNATEFHTGVGFRFRASRNRWARIGNGGYSIPRPVARHVRLADIVAASSCFPGGFEPIVFPRHFRWPTDFPLERAREELGDAFTGGLPLMDGGIYDNQGVDGLVLAFRRSDATTLFVSDVSVRQDRIYDAPGAPPGRGWVTLGMVGWAGWIVFALAVVAACVLGAHGWAAARDGGWGVEDWFLYLVPGLLSAVVAGALLYVRRRIDDALRMAGRVARLSAWPSLRRLTVPEFVEMAGLRAGSLLALTSSIFMKRIRGLVYASVWRDAEFDDRRIAALIDGLTTPQPRLFGEFPWLEPREVLRGVARDAQRMPTTLWFDDDAQLMTLRLAGEATACFALLRFIVRSRAGEYEEPGAPLHELFVRLRAEWSAFNGAAMVPGPLGPVVAHAAADA